jgi:hypothetical protein
MFERKLFCLVALLFFLGTISHSAEPKPPWQQEWEKTLQAAKK